MCFQATPVPTPNSVPPRTPARRVAEHLAAQLIQQSAMASPGPRQHELFSPGANLRDSSDSDEFPICQPQCPQHTRTLTQTPTAGGMVTLNSEDSQDKYEALAPFPKPTTQRECSYQSNFNLI